MKAIKARKALSRVRKTKRSRVRLSGWIKPLKIFLVVLSEISRDNKKRGLRLKASSSYTVSQCFNIGFIPRPKIVYKKELNSINASHLQVQHEICMGKLIMLPSSVCALALNFSLNCRVFFLFVHFNGHP